MPTSHLTPRLTALWFLLVIVGGLTLLTPPSPGWAANCSIGPHCVAVIQWNFPAGTTGAAMEIDAAQLQAATSCDTLNDDLWVYDDPNGYDWVEQGLLSGAEWQPNAPPVCTNSLIHFWADYRPSGYYQHNKEVASLNTTYADWIWQTGPTQYTLQWGAAGGPYSQYTSTNDEGAPTYFWAGSETNSTSSVGQLSSYDPSLSYLNGGTWQIGWINATWLGTGSPPNCGNWTAYWSEIYLYKC